MVADVFGYDFTYEAYRDALMEMDVPAYRADQLFSWMYGRRVRSYEEMTNIPAKLRSQLAERMPLVELKELTRLTSQDGTVKWLFGLHDGHAIETVVMRHDYGISICVTTQVGCRMGCTFCASTIGGLKRNLSAGEIVAQVVHAQRALDETGERIRSIVVMGSGEPFENYDATVTFLELMMDPKAMHIGQRHITVSTSGLVPRIIDFANWDTQITLALSLHAPNDVLRSRLMPINRKYPLDTVIEACRYYVAHTGRRITMEYALMHEVNDTVECARELAALLKGMLVHVNLIPVNHVVERDFVRTPPEAVQAFQATLRQNHINTTIRREQGHDIAAACGQLRAQYMASNP